MQEPTILDVAELDYTKKGDVKMASIDFDACEARVMYFEPGQEIALHSHSAPTMKVVLSGEVEFDGRQLVAGMVYQCGGWEYRGIARKESYVLMLQPPGTERRVAGGA